MKLYLAAKYSQREEIAAYAAVLNAAGYTITSRWLLGEHEIKEPPDGDSGNLRHYDAKLNDRFAREDIEDLLSADVFVGFNEYEMRLGRGGRHVEFGIALASRKPIVMCGPRENVFHYLDEVLFVDDLEGVFRCLEYIEQGVGFEQESAHSSSGDS